VKAKVASLLTNLRAEPVVKGRRQHLFDSSQLKGWGDLGGVKILEWGQSCIVALCIMRFSPHEPSP
jgi:hypothetical protein